MQASYRLKKARRSERGTNKTKEFFMIINNKKDKPGLHIRVFRLIFVKLVSIV